MQSWITGLNKQLEQQTEYIWDMDNCMLDLIKRVIQIRMWTFYDMGITDVHIR